MIYWMVDGFINYIRLDSAPGVTFMEDPPIPLKRGSSKKTISKNISEFHKGNTYAKTKKKFGVSRANAQAIAASLRQAGKSSKSKKKKSK